MAYLVICEGCTGIPPDFCIPHNSRWIFIIITILPSITCSSFQVGSTTSMWLSRKRRQIGQTYSPCAFGKMPIVTHRGMWWILKGTKSLSHGGCYSFSFETQREHTIITVGPIVTSGLLKCWRAVIAPILQQSVKFPLSSRILMSTLIDQTSRG